MLNQIETEIFSLEQQTSLIEKKISTILADWTGNVDGVVDRYESLFQYNSALDETLHNFFQEKTVLYQKQFELGVGALQQSSGFPGEFNYGNSNIWSYVTFPLREYE